MKPREVGEGFALAERWEVALLMAMCFQCMCRTKDVAEIR